MVDHGNVVGMMRIGKFSIDCYDFVHGNTDFVKDVLRDLLIVRAERMFHNDSIEYIAIGDCFDEVGLGESPPKYAKIIKRTENGVVFEGFKRL